MKSAALLSAFHPVADVSLLGHQGGWDEILLVVGPLAVVAGLLWLANRRVSAQLQAAQSADDQSADDQSTGVMGQTGEATAEGGEGTGGSSGTDVRP